MNFWENIDDELLSKDYICGYCGCYIASQKGYEGFFVLDQMNRLE
ncbi:hypothetical protein ABRQ56_00030 [Clostridioides difficile]|nr:hypothetical protein [Clostridioides difficile]